MLEYPRREQIYLETDEYMQPGVTYAIRIKWVKFFPLMLVPAGQGGIHQALIYFEPEKTIIF